MFPLLLNGWKSKAKNEHLAKDCDEIQKMWPSVSEVEWNLFEEHGKTLKVKVVEKNEVEYASTKTNTIGSRGYPGKRLKCAKQDFEFVAAAHQTPSSTSKTRAIMISSEYGTIGTRRIRKRHSWTNNN